jgi:transposase-like protein
MHSAEFKARVALGAIRGIKTVQQITAHNELHPKQITQWKTQVVEGAAGVFDAGRGRKTKQEVFEQREQRLERKISQLVAEIILHAGGGILCASV